MSKILQPRPPHLRLPLMQGLWGFKFDRLGFLRRVAASCGDIATTRIGPFASTFVNHPDLVREVLVERARDYRKTPRQHRATEPIIGRGLLISEDDEHHRQRRLLAPVFQPPRLKQYADVVVAQAEQLVMEVPPYLTCSCTLTLAPK